MEKEIDIAALFEMEQHEVDQIGFTEESVDELSNNKGDDEDE